MMLPVNLRVFLAVGTTRHAQSINGLCLRVQMQMELDPFAGHLFAFCKPPPEYGQILYWDRNGFCLWQKRLERAPVCLARESEPRCSALTAESLTGLAGGARYPAVSFSRSASLFFDWIVKKRSKKGLQLIYASAIRRACVWMFTASRMTPPNSSNHRHVEQ